MEAFGNQRQIFLMLDVFVGEYLPKCAKDRYEKNFYILPTNEAYLPK